MSFKDARIELLNSPDKVAPFLEWFARPRAFMVLDIETNALTWNAGGMTRLVQFGDHEMGWSIPFDRWKGLIMHVLKTWDGVWVGHNFTYDLTMLWANTGWTPDWSKVHDTFLMSRVVNDYGFHALKILGQYMVDPQAALGQHALKDAFDKYGFDWATVPIELPEYWLYGGLDVVLNYYVAEALIERVMSNPGWRWTYMNERATMEAIHLVQAHGMHVDASYAELKRAELIGKADDIARRVRTEYGDNIAIGSGDSVTSFLLAEGVPLYETTKTGKMKFDKDVIAEFYTVHPLVPMVDEYRRALRFANNYYGKFIDMRDSEDMVHAEFKQAEANTLRMAVSNPPLQQVPSRGAESRMVRDAITARDGNVLVSCDLSQIEFRLFAYLTGSEPLKKSIRDGLDAHYFVASKAFRKEMDQITGDERGYAKGVTFGSIFGAGATKISQTMKVDPDTGQGIYDAVMRAFPEIKQYQKDTETEARAMGTDMYAKHQTVFGNTLRVDLEDAYKLGNYRIQSAAAEIFKSCVNRAVAAGLGQYMTCFVHDEIVTEVPIHEADEVRATLEECMTDYDVLPGVPVTCESASAHSWGKCK